MSGGRKVSVNKTDSNSIKTWFNSNYGANISVDQLDMSQIQKRKHLSAANRIGRPTGCKSERERHTGCQYLEVFQFTFPEKRGTEQLGLYRAVSLVL
jgi:hypothetical protein